ncbi:Hint domain-containing protein [Paracoccus pacificus]|uniref:Hint domain-containing protein n=1 Tax=Paracoccus pacificus TaxID=1463598 RepID=A0ABW4R4R8_9RHOB
MASIKATWYLTDLTRANTQTTNWSIGTTSTPVKVWFGTAAEKSAENPSSPPYDLIIVDSTSTNGQSTPHAVDSTELRNALLAYDANNPGLTYNLSNNAGFVGTADANIDSDPEIEKTAAFAIDGKSIQSSTKAVMISLEDPTLPNANLGYKPGQGNFKPFGPGTLGPPCLTRGTRVATPLGEVAVENLSDGDLVVTKDHGAKRIARILGKTLSPSELLWNPELRPVCISAGALGHGLPEADLIVSPQHRILVRSKIAQRMFGVPEVLVAAKRLTALDGIEVVHDLEQVEYFHILFDQHEVIFANGAETESLYTGAEALRSVGKAAREEILTLFPMLRDGGAMPIPARVIASGRRGQQLAQRHLDAGKPLL